MFRKTVYIIWAALALLSLSGCTGMLEGDFFSISQFQESEQHNEADRTEIRSYSDLKNIITWLVSHHEERGELKFSNYKGDINEDLPRACREVMRDTPLGAFAVDYLSSDLSRAVYYEASVNITYKRTKEQIDRVEPLDSSRAINESIGGALSEMGDYLAIQVSAGLADTDSIREIARDSYYADPMGAVLLPRMEINTFPESGLQRIYEITFHYGYDKEQLTRMRSELKEAVSHLVLEAPGDSQTVQALFVCQLISNLSSYLPSAPRLGSEEGDQEGPASLSGSAYGALVEKAADSEGFAMAFKALCQQLGIECLVVRGSLDMIPHVWNIIRIDEDYYHVDSSQVRSEGISSVFMKSDEDFRDRYWWDQEGCVQCAGSYTYDEQVSDIPAPENNLE